MPPTEFIFTKKKQRNYPKIYGPSNFKHYLTPNYIFFLQSNL